jgi:transposase
MRSNKKRDAEIKRLRKEISKLRKENAELRKRIAELETIVKQLTAGPILKEPPSWVKPRNQKSRPKKSGAKKGHTPNHREVNDVDEENEVMLAFCPHCDTALGEPIDERERITEDIVPARLKITKHIVYRYWCPTCKEKVEGQPEGVLPGQHFGLHLMLLICYLRTLGLTWLKIQTYLYEAFGIKISHGGLIHMEEVVAKALGSLYKHLQDDIRKAKEVHADDTSWRIDGENHWLWIFLTKAVAYYTIRESRSRKVIEDCLGPEFNGVVVLDFYPSFMNLPYEQQKCIVHLLRKMRDFEKKPDFKPGREWKRVKMRVKRMVTEALNANENMNNLEERSLLKRRLIARAEAVSQLPRRHRYAKKIATLVGQYKESLFTFLDHDVHWENNPAERGLRPMVVNRKTSFGSKSDEGAERRAILQSTAETARLQGTSFINFAGAELGLPPQQSLP